MLLEAELTGWEEAGANIMSPPAASGAPSQDEVAADLLSVRMLGRGRGMGGHGAKHLWWDGGKLCLTPLSG